VRGADEAAPGAQIGSRTADRPAGRREDVERRRRRPGATVLYGREQPARIVATQDGIEKLGGESERLAEVRLDFHLRGQVAVGLSPARGRPRKARGQRLLLPFLERDDEPAPV
jgi:hypothetical protein